MMSLLLHETRYYSKILKRSLNKVTFFMEAYKQIRNFLRQNGPQPVPRFANQSTASLLREDFKEFFASTSELISTDGTVYCDPNLEEQAFQLISAECSFFNNPITIEKAVNEISKRDKLAKYMFHDDDMVGFFSFVARQRKRLSVSGDCVLVINDHSQSRESKLGIDKQLRLPCAISFIMNLLRQSEDGLTFGQLASKLVDAPDHVRKAIHTKSCKAKRVEEFVNENARKLILVNEFFRVKCAENPAWEELCLRLLLDRSNKIEQKCNAPNCEAEPFGFPFAKKISKARAIKATRPKKKLEGQLKCDSGVICEKQIISNPTPKSKSKGKASRRTRAKRRSAEQLHSVQNKTHHSSTERCSPFAVQQKSPRYPSCDAHSQQTLPRTQSGFPKNRPCTPHKYGRTLNIASQMQTDPKVDSQIVTAPFPPFLQTDCWPKLDTDQILYSNVVRKNSPESVHSSKIEPTAHSAHSSPKPISLTPKVMTANPIPDEPLKSYQLFPNTASEKKALVPQLAQPVLTLRYDLFRPAACKANTEGVTAVPQHRFQSNLRRDTETAESNSAEIKFTKGKEATQNGERQRSFDDNSCSVTAAYTAVQPLKGLSTANNQQAAATLVTTTASKPRVSQATVIPTHQAAFVPPVVDNLRRKLTEHSGSVMHINLLYVWHLRSGNKIQFSNVNALNDFVAKCSHFVAEGGLVRLAVQ